MRLYGALSELAELIIRLASGKTVKISAENQPSGGTEKVVSIPDMGASDADELVLKDLEQTLTKKTLQGSTTADGEGNLTSDSVISTVDVAASTLQIPVVSNSNDRPVDQRKAGALTLAAGEVHVGQGDGTFKSLADLSSSQVMTNKTISSSSFQGQINNTTLGASSDVQILGVSTLDISNLATSGNNHVVITNADGEVETEAALAKVRGGIGADATNIIFPASGTLVTEAGTQTLSNKTIGSVTAENGLLSISGVGALKIPAGTQAERPASPVEGMMRYNSETDSFEGYASNTWSGIGGGGTVDRIAQVNHGFALGDVLWFDPGTPPNVPAFYAKASAAADNTAEVVGLVSRVIDADNFEMTLSGEVAGLSGLTAGAVYFLSATTAGALTTTEPSVVGQVSLPVGVASSATSLYVAPKRGVVVGAANLRTQIGLDGDALLVRTTNIQKITSYDAGELAGWVELNATTDYKFYVQAQFVKNAAGVWNISYQTTGDTPPAGFNMDIVTSGPDAFIQVSLPAMAGYVSGKINFALNAPAVGTSLPLSVNADSILLNGSAFPPALYNSANADIVMSASSPSFQHVVSPSAARTVTLPSVGIKAGYQMKLIVTGATETNFVKLQSSGGNEIDRIGGEGYIKVVALQDTPTTAAHWFLEHVQESLSITNTWNLAQVTGSVTLRLERKNKLAAIYVPGFGSGGTILNSTAAWSFGVVPVRFASYANGATATVGIRITSNGGTPESGMFYLAGSTREIQIFRNAGGAGFISGTNNNAITSPYTFTYRCN